MPSRGLCRQNGYARMLDFDPTQLWSMWTHTDMSAKLCRNEFMSDHCSGIAMWTRPKSGWTQVRLVRGVGPVFAGCHLVWPNTHLVWSNTHLVEILNDLLWHRKSTLSQIIHHVFVLTCMKIDLFSMIMGSESNESYLFFAMVGCCVDVTYVKLQPL